MANAMHRFDNAKRRRDSNHDRQRQLTPEYVLRPVRDALGGCIDLDPCTEAENPTGARAFFALPDDGLAQEWPGETVYCNPPYGEARLPWIKRCLREASNGKAIVLLLPAHTETAGFQEALAGADWVCFVRARIMFSAVRKNGRHEAASHGSALLCYGADGKCLRSLGVVLQARAAKTETKGETT